MTQRVLDRLDGIIPFPEFASSVKHQLVADQKAASEHPQFGGLIPILYKALAGADDDVLEVWHAAWTMLSGFWQQFDHVTDGDTYGPGSYGLNLNGVVGYAFAAAAMLDELEEAPHLSQRVARLRRIWNDSVLRTAAGQHRDLELLCDLALPTSTSTPHDVMIASQELARVKAGSLYALAFGGTAILATDDQVTVDLLRQIGEVYGMLLMYADDVRDVNDPNESPLSFAHALLRAAPGLGLTPSNETPEDFYKFVYRQYLAYVGILTTQLPKSVHEPIRRLFAMTFEQQNERSSASDTSG